MADGTPAFADSEIRSLDEERGRDSKVPRELDDLRLTWRALAVEDERRGRLASDHAAQVAYRHAAFLHQELDPIVGGGLGKSVVTSPPLRFVRLLGTTSPSK